MKRARSFAAALLVLGLGLSASRIAAASGRVYLSDTATDHPSPLLEELQSVGYDVQRAASEPSPCTAGVVAAAESGASAWIAVTFETASDELVSTICYVAPRAAPEQTLVRVSAGDPRRFALATVEALNGLAARPRRAADASVAPASAAPEPTRAHEPSWSALAANAALEVDAAGGRPLVGAVAGLDTAVAGRFSLALEAFIPLRETNAGGTNRELSLGMTWARVGPRMVWTLAPLRIALSLQGGAALVWASAETTPPLIGTTEQTASALVAGGLSLECPEDTLVYLRAAGGAARLFPHVELALGDGATRAFGELLLEMNLGIGLRWDTAR